MLVIKRCGKSDAHNCERIKSVFTKFHQRVYAF